MKAKKLRILEYKTIFTPEEEGGYSVSVPDLPGCFSQGKTFEEAKDNIKEAIELYLEDADKEFYFVNPEESRKEFIVPVSVKLNA